jgi:hypothetical protein
VESTLSLAVSLLEAAALLPPGAIKKRCQEAGQAYAMSVLNLPHRASEGRFLVSFAMRSDPSQKAEYAEPYRYGYGGGFGADDAALVLALFRLTSDPRALELAEQLANYYGSQEPPPPHEIVRAHVYASIIGLQADLYSIGKKPEHLQQAERYARLAIERLFYKNLFRGATSLNHYEGDLMAGNLAYNLLWLHALKNSPGEVIAPNYFNR